MNKTKLNKKGEIKKLDFLIAIDKLKQLPDKNENTIKKYIADLRRFVKITGCNELVECFNNHKKIIDEIENFKQPNGEHYGVNTIKSLIQSILYLITELNIDVNDKSIKEYKLEFEKYKLLSSEHTQEKKDNNPNQDLTFEEYLDKVKNEFTVSSKMYLIANLYHDLTGRDDFGQIIIVSSLSKATDKEKNYIVLPIRNQATIILNKYKTSEKYDQINEKLTTNTTKLLRDYMKTNNIKYDGVLFNDSSLSSYISKNNLKLGIKGSINIFRKMKATQNQTLTPKERILEARKSGHSARTSKTVYSFK
jgi:hypothetical protein